MREGGPVLTPLICCVYRAQMGKLRQGGDAVQQRGVTHGVGAASGEGDTRPGTPV